jgi:hypothetical protein
MIIIKLRGFEKQKVQAGTRNLIITTISPIKSRSKKIARQHLPGLN